MSLQLGWGSGAQAQSPEQGDTLTAQPGSTPSPGLSWMGHRSLGPPWSCEEGESWVTAKLPLLSCQAALPESCPQLQGRLSPAGELCSPVRLLLKHSPAYPCGVPTHSSFSTWEPQKEASTGPAAPQPEGRRAPARSCGKDTGAGRCPMVGVGQSCCPSPGSL